MVAGRHSRVLLSSFASSVPRLHPAGKPATARGGVRLRGDAQVRPTEPLAGGTAWPLS